MRPSRLSADQASLLIGLLIPLWLLPALVSCAGGKRTYHLDAGARYEIYREKLDVPLDTALSRSLLLDIRTVDGDPSQVRSTAVGGQLGVTEQVGVVVTKLSAFYSKYSDVSYTFVNFSNGQTISETLSPTAFGIDSSLGFQLSVFRPRVSYKYQRMDFNAVVTTSSGSQPVDMSTSQFFVGGGLAIDIPVTPKFHIVAEGDYRVPLSTEGSTIHEITTQLGVRVGGWEVN
jgi:hypothetical protein